jgi:hypothetical protein
LIPLTGGVVWAAITWLHWPLFASLAALQLATLGRDTETSILGPEFRDAHLSHSNLSAWLSFGLVLAVWRWWPRAERQTDDPSHLRAMKWTTIAIAFLVVATAIAPRRIAWDRFEVVLYENRPWCVIAADSDEWLLFAADNIGTTLRRIRRDAPGVEPTSTDRALVDR